LEPFFESFGANAIASIYTGSSIPSAALNNSFPLSITSINSIPYLPYPCNLAKNLHTAYIERVADFARKEYLRTLSYRVQETPLEEQSEDTLALVEGISRANLTLPKAGYLWR